MLLFLVVPDSPSLKKNALPRRLTEIIMLHCIPSQQHCYYTIVCVIVWVAFISILHVVMIICMAYIWLSLAVCFLVIYAME